MADHQPIAPPTLAPPAARYAHGVRTSGATRWLHTSGVVPIAPDGSVPSEIVDQAQVIWSNIASMLADADMASSDVVAVTTYVTPGHNLAPLMAMRDEALGGHLAASTLVIVAELARPEWLMEISIVAAA